LGYAIGAILTGILADAFGLDSAIWAVGLLTIASAIVIWQRMEKPSRIGKFAQKEMEYSNQSK
jgi:predicted MFS family arabinose efflux permease